MHSAECAWSRWRARTRTESTRVSGSWRVRARQRDAAHAAACTRCCRCSTATTSATQGTYSLPAIWITCALQGAVPAPLEASDTFYKSAFAGNLGASPPPPARTAAPPAPSRLACGLCNDVRCVMTMCVQWFECVGACSTGRVSGAAATSASAAHTVGRCEQFESRRAIVTVTCVQVRTSRRRHRCGQQRVRQCVRSV
jgi:hypothetical protein